ncbi:hypothetical protein AC578_9016 [Pseudocercospora eumusae]|uniref:Mid2 domain-containing protein n=1 Tax=Pseudocercospora eumusae TaxID=321146 RepID=A0A139H2Q1_9PEZI|nr:hypothetical protein AC578_9016 [Pseudocercospora eumusae]
MFEVPFSLSILLLAWSSQSNAVELSPSCTPTPRAYSLSDAIFQPAPEQILLRRDACANAFGDRWIGSFCTPGSTYCCVNPSKAVPLCQQYLGIGWCCTQDGGCYADLQSACGQPGAVSCTDLAQGVDEACCPQYTTCASGYNASANFVRCNIQQTDLQALASSTSTLAGASTASLTASQDMATLKTTSTLSSSRQSSSSSSASSNSALSNAFLATATESTVSTSPGASKLATSAAPSASSPTLAAVAYVKSEHGVTLSTGAIAGIAVGAAIGGLLIAAVAWLVWRRKVQAKNAQGCPSKTPPASLPHDHGFTEQSIVHEKSHDSVNLFSVSGRYYKQSYSPKQELPGVDWRSPAELATERF